MASTTATVERSAWGPLAALWGATGFMLVLLLAVVRLTPLAVESFSYDWSGLHYAVFAVNMVFMGYTEGYKGFQKSYSPRFASRIRHLYFNANPWQAVFAPVVAMGFVSATRRRLLSAWLLTVGVVGLVMLYRALPHPWRGILDAGVVLGLSWGALATLWSIWRTFRDGTDVDPEFA